MLAIPPQRRGRPPPPRPRWPPPIRNSSLVSPPCRVDRAIGGDQPLFARAALDRIAMLHADHAREILRAQPAADVALVDLAAPGLVAAGVVAELDVGALVPAGAQRIDQIPHLDLPVRQVRELLARGTCYRRR